MQKIGFIGAGNMASAIIRGMVENGFKGSQIGVADLNQSLLDTLKEDVGVATFDTNSALMDFADIIILAVKPQVMTTVLTQIKASYNTERHLMVSVAAGISIQGIQQDIGNNNAAVVRVMPNTPSLIGEGMSGLYANEFCSPDQKEMVEHIMAAVGQVLWLDEEDKIHAVTAISGSGPAYYFHFMEAMIAAAIEYGIDRESATKLVLQTAKGAAHLAISSSDDVTQLRKKVTSPGGTTEQGVNSMKESGLDDIVKKGMNAARDRSVELGKM